jgi:hypothetical protein
MGPKKEIKKVEMLRKTIELSDSESDESDEDVIQPKSMTRFVTSKHDIISSVKDTRSGTTDRIVLSKALNDFTSISESFCDAVDKWKEITSDRISDIVGNIESKKIEYSELIENKEKEYKNKEKDVEDKYKNKKIDLQQEYKILNIELDQLFKNKHIELEQEFKNKQIDIEQRFKNKQIDIEQQNKNKQIETEQQLREFQIVACEKIANNNDYMLITKKDYEKTQSDLEILKDNLSDIEGNIEDRINKMIEIEKASLQEKLKQDNLTKDLNHKAEIADLIAQNKQQVKEIEFMNRINDNLTNEVSEQRNLTKEIAKASSKSQITQSFTKDSH